MDDKPSEKSRERVRTLVESYCRKSGTATHPDTSITEAESLGLAQNLGGSGATAVVTILAAA